MLACFGCSGCSEGAIEQLAIKADRTFVTMPWHPWDRLPILAGVALSQHIGECTINSVYNPFKFVQIVLLLVLSLGLVLSGRVDPAQAQVFFEQPRIFVVSKACDATTSIRKQTNPVPLQVGDRYPALGENKQPGTHTLIEVEGQGKWVALSCGQVIAADIPLEPPAEPPVEENEKPQDQPEPRTASRFSPFFDTVDEGPQDLTPPPPVLNLFDQAVVDVCGLPGHMVVPSDFKAMMAAFPEVLTQIKSFTHQEFVSDEAFLDRLTEIWFSDGHGFNHIFCGEPQAGGKIGGLHFAGRYLQLQEAGLGGRLLNNERREEVVPGIIYTLGAEVAVDGDIARSPIKGYGLTLSAEDILKFATKAFFDNPTDSSQSQACMLKVQDDGCDFDAVFVRRASGIRTFYPDATPSPTDPRCRFLGSPN
jgi:hypothetical protein